MSDANSEGTQEPLLDFDARAWASRLLGRISRRDGLDRLLPVFVVVLVAAAAVISSLPSVPAATAAARPTDVPAAAVPGARYADGDGPSATGATDLYLGDGTLPNTLQNPAAGADARTLLVYYTVRGGDTLNKIAARFGLAPSTIYWANRSKLPDPQALRAGTVLTIPPMDGLIVTVGAKDTLASLAAKYRVDQQDIIDANNLLEPAVVIGQTVIIPGASGGAMPKPKPGQPGAAPGGWYWPVSGDNYISQYYWSRHHALDIAADQGTPVIAAASGTVVYAGWRSTTGGGNVVWIMHGSKLYSTYNHLSWWGVRVGQRVSAGQLIARVGQTGVATGPHLHFEVWLGQPWALGNDSDAVNPCNYLAAC